MEFVFLAFFEMDCILTTNWVLRISFSLQNNQLKYLKNPICSLQISSK